MAVELLGAAVLVVTSLFAQAGANDSGNDADEVVKPVPVLSLTFDQPDEFPKGSIVNKLNVKGEGPRPPQFPKMTPTNIAAEFKGGPGAGRLDQGPGG